MGVTFTKDQQSAIDLRDCNILVSAAAGSGKTAVLTQRVLTRLTTDEPPIDIDQLLIVTYTEAAAAEMRERIRDAIETALEMDPENLHLQRQSTLVHRAQITTIHGFCLNVIRDYFHKIDLDPAFRAAESGELELLKQDVLAEMLEEQYQEGSPEFLKFIESYVYGEEDFVLKLYAHSRSYPNPEEWLENCVQQYDVPTEEALEQTKLVQYIMSRIRTEIAECVELVKQAIVISESEGGPDQYRDALDSDLLVLKSLQTAKDFRALQERSQAVVWETLSRKKGVGVQEEKKDLVKGIRDRYKKIIDKLKADFLYDDVSAMRQDLYDTKASVQMLVKLTQEFADRFRERKHRNNMIDFDDMLYYALQILTEKQGENFVPSGAAKEYQEKFVEVMIDEYQDSNLIQDTILRSVSRVQDGTPNIFMVGDVKQSIYRFRLSMPELFMEKYDTYSENSGPSQKIDLHKNFRSRKSVLDSVNYVFEQIMGKNFGGIAYDEKASLVYGDTYQDDRDCATEVCYVEAEGFKRKDSMELEALAVAKKIKEIVGVQEIYDRKTDSYRKAGYGDIVILLHTLKGWVDVFQRVLTEQGVPCYSSSKTGYFQVREIQMLLDYLRILDNPRQDIPFAAVLHSVFGHVTSEELAMVKSSASEGTLYEMARAYAEQGADPTLREKLQTFLVQFESLRERVPYTAIHTLLWNIMEETGYDSYVAALPAGERRAANLDLLIDKAIAFESTSYKGLFHFVRYIDRLEKCEVDYGEAATSEDGVGVVQLISIHKSKGLEYPIVFVAEMSKRFVLNDAYAELVIHPTWGVGLPVVDVEKRTKAATLMKRVIEKEIIDETVAEELRVLYVAMTRAKEKLILIGALDKEGRYDAACQKLLGRKETMLPYSYISGARQYFDWIVPALYRRTKAVPITEQLILLEELFLAEAEEQFRDCVTKEELLCQNPDAVYDAECKEAIQAQFSYVYPFLAEQKRAQKISVSELKKRAYQEEDEAEEEVVIPLLPRFLQDTVPMTGAMRGSAYHKCLECLDFTKEYDVSTLAREIQAMGDAEMADCIEPSEILAFLNSAIGQRMKCAARQGKLHKEQPFVLGEFDSEVDLVQGIIDVYFEEDGEIVVLDYKTDRVSEAEELRERYQVQLDYYAKALSRITELPVKEKVIYSFALQSEILLSHV